MARQLTVNKSNYFITGGMYALGNGEDIIVKMLGKKGIKKLFSFLGGKIYGSVIRSSDFKKNKWFTRFQDNPSQDNLKNILNSKHLTKVEKGEYTINQLSAQVFFEVLSKIESGQSLDDIMKENRWVKVLYEFYGLEMPDYMAKYLWTFNPSWLEVSDGFADDIILLIEGYEYYLLHRGKRSDRQLCGHIEEKVIKKVLNVRQDFHQYERFFEEMGSAVDITIDNEFKITYLKLCADPYLPA